VNTSRLAGNQAETAIAINPTNPSNIAITSNVQFGAKLFKSVSFDSGHQQGPGGRPADRSHWSRRRLGHVQVAGTIL
jgi:hypothetical protein